MVASIELAPARITRYFETCGTVEVMQFSDGWRWYCERLSVNWSRARFAMMADAYQGALFCAAGVADDAA